MDGYSIQEAASVLGVAEGRVWELLARGVLFGTPEGDSMRVFLKAQPGPIASAGTRDEAPRTNGNGGSHGSAGEASAFRELLTEFRNLTERYGQALLALGEARGEVAGLRSRVDQLEARFDLRLPPPLEAAPVAWESTSGPDAAPEAPSPATRAPRRPRTPVQRPPRPRRAPSARETVAGFADALARAQDPNAADLGGADQTEAAAPDEPRDQTESPVTAAPEVVDAAPEAVEAPEPAEQEPIAASDLAVEAPEADQPVAEPEAPTYSAVVVEPDWFADGDFAWLDAAELETSGQVDVAGLETAEPEPQQATDEVDAVAEHDAIAEPEPTPADTPVEAEAAPAPPATPEPALEFETPADFESWRPPTASVPEVASEPEIADAPEPQAMSAAVAAQDVEEEVMWLGAEPEASQPVTDEPPVQGQAEVQAWPTADATPAVEVVRPPLAMTEEELSRLALDEGWDEAEVAAIRAMITPPPEPRVVLPGASELDEAMAALEAVPVRSDFGSDGSRQWTKPAPDDAAAPAIDDWAFEAEPPPEPPIAPRPPADVTAELRRGASGAGRLRPREGPAAAAYRRLRRLLPG
jgi:hypothetical protein